MKNEDTKKEGYPNVKEFEKVWIKINGNWNGNQVVDVIEFEVVKNGN